LIQINAKPRTTGNACFVFNGACKMRSGEFYYLLMVIGSFGAFGLAIAASYIQYRRWLKQQQPAKIAKSASPRR
jgi:hypothetical protein